MTFKKIVEAMVKEDGVTWFRYILAENSVAYRFLQVKSINFEQEEHKLYYYWTIRVLVLLEDCTQKVFYIDGTADEYGIDHTIIRDDNHHFLWADLEKTRKDLGITEFKIS